MTTSGEMRLSCLARPDQSAPMRHAVGAFLKALCVDPNTMDDILTAVGEALANAVEHAYPDGSNGVVALVARTLEDETVAISISDSGSFVRRDRTTNRGFGLQIIKSIARDVSIDTHDGTTVRMTLDAKRSDTIVR